MEDLQISGVDLAKRTFAARRIGRIGSVAFSKKLRRLQLQSNAIRTAILCCRNRGLWFSSPLGRERLNPAS